MKLELVLAAGFATAVIGLAFYSSPVQRVPFSPILLSAVSSASSIPVPSAPLLSVYNASPKLDDEEEAAIKRKDAMLERCHVGGGIPVRGIRRWRGSREGSVPEKIRVH